MYRAPAAAAPRVCRGFSCALGRGPWAQPGFPFSLLSFTVESTVTFSDWASRCSVVFWSQKKTSRFPFPPGAPPTGTAAVGGGGRWVACAPRLKLSSLLASGLPHSPFPASARGAPCVLDCTGGHRAGAAPHGQHRAGVLRCPGLPLSLSDGQACLGSGGRSPALACGSRAGAPLFLAGVPLRTRHLLLVSGGLSRPRRPVSLVTQQCPCCCFWER